MSTEVEFVGNFEIHLTVRAASATELAAVESFGVRREMKFTHIVLARGRVADQPMLTLRHTGDLASVTALAESAAADLRAADFALIRTKIEADYRARGVPATDRRARELGSRYYFEHHIKVVLPADADLVALAAACAGHHAHVSANARRVREDGRAERFVTQRCTLSGRHSAEHRLGLLRAVLREHGYEILSTEQEFVVFDSDESVDDGWLSADGGTAPVTPWRHAPRGPWRAEQHRVPTEPPTNDRVDPARFPATLLPVGGVGVRQRPVFDPAFADRWHGMRLSEPAFDDDTIARTWRTARRAALDHVLAGLADTPWAERVMVRGSVLLRAWFGEDAREPGDLDFVVLDPTWTLDDPRTAAAFDEIAAAATARAAQPDSTVRIDPAAAVSDQIWTYDRVPGRRLLLPWSSIEPGVPGGSVQLDFVFGEQLPEPPVRTELARLATPGPATILLAASPRLSLAWKLLWLATDIYPEGKDLYDAVLLAEHTDLPPALFRAVTADADDGPWVADFADGATWAQAADWPEFAKDHPLLVDEHDAYVWRLATALAALRPEGMAGAVARLTPRETLGLEDLRAAFRTGGLPALAPALDRYPRATVFRLMTVRAVLGPETCTLREAAEVLLRMPVPADSVLPTRVDPRVIAARLESVAST
ncbi:nucleotidyl transferase AbiEii/AbiGii toxin family protein [Nocardia sp. AG03]|uniref:nucleotidyl transferase AbiEii/AbiGii toxin family protein n=1 Tax=Nocardia sp. AG03 TaxID=3025312 RepID=UPI00241875B3|nr:nucleotidyl transferase AbiEii/AbiGii toxin family protein [Nocardia sp. AG03]